MADEITYTAKLAVIKGSKTYSRTVSGVVTMTGLPSIAGDTSIATTAAGVALAIGDVTTCGWAFFRNLDATNYIEIGVNSAGTFYPTLKLKAGEANVVRLASNAPYARANTSAVRLEFQIFQD